MVEKGRSDDLVVHLAVTWAMRFVRQPIADMSGDVAHAT